MKAIIKQLKVIHKAFPNLFMNNKKDKNGNLCINIIGLDAMQEQLLPQQVQSLITLVPSELVGYKASFTPPYKSTNGTGILYIGKNTATTSEADLDGFNL